jgi:DNA-binding CsgD family transcriptional regulator/tetratricopeptide (TPR) repeat protein
MLVEHNVVCPTLIGRDAALSAALHALGRARAGHGSALLISGEAGIGKSRLARDLARRAREDGFIILQGACFETDRAHPYAPILDLVRVLSATSAGLAAHYFASAADELVTLFPELRSVFPDATPAQDANDPEDERRRLFHSFAEAIRTLARVQPLLLVIEDVHWSDDATLDLMRHLARGIESERVTLVLTYRSDEVGPRLARLLADFDRARCAADIPLQPLGVGQVSAMLQAIFGSQPTFEAAFVSALHERTEGNPFFVEEMLKGLVVAGDLVQTDGRWSARPLEHVRVPRTATEAVGRRLAGLSEPAREVASVAAVTGRRFDFSILQELTRQDERALLGLVRELVDAQLVVEESADCFAFRHALTREAMCARLLARERVALHRAIAAAVERRFDESTHDLDDTLAYHAFEAGEWLAARRFALRAASHASTLCAPREALQHLERAVIATEKAGLPVDPALFAARGRAHEILGAFPQANADFTAALSAARASGDRRNEWESLHALGLLWAARDYQQVIEYRRDALEVARSMNDPILIAHSLNRVGNWHVNREDPQSGIPYHDEALAIFETAGDRRGVAETVDLLAMSHHIAGEQSTAVELYERAVTLFAELEHRRGLANALSVMIVCGPSHHASAGRVRASEVGVEAQRSERMLKLTGEIGWRAGEAFSRYCLADVLMWRGEYRRALRFARESLAIAEEMEHLEWQCGARRVLGMIALDLCSADEARRHLEVAHDIAQRLASATWMRWTAAPFAVVLSRIGEASRAAQILDDVERALPGSAIHVKTPDDDRRTLGERYMTLARAEVALAMGDSSRALEIANEDDVRGVPALGLIRARALIAAQQWSEAHHALDVAREDAAAQESRPLVWRIDALAGAAHLGERHRLEARRALDAARATAAELFPELEGEPAFAASLRAGVDAAAPPAPEPTVAQAAKTAYGGLTQRERETAALIAQGKSNRAIARALGIGERTVEGYVASILGKLGFNSRTQIAAWTVEQTRGDSANPVAR